MSNFAFLSAGFPAVAGAAASAERLAGVGEGADPTLAAVSAGRAAELAVKWAYANDDALTPPYQSTVSTLIHERAFRELCGQAVFEKLRYVNKVRNRAAHEDRGVPASVAQGAVRELFHVLYWFARAYAADKPDAGLAFDASVFTRRAELMAAAATHIKAQKAEIEKRDAEIERLREAAARGPALDEAHARRREEVAKARAAAQAPPDPHDYDEAATRDRFIDVLLAEAGWTDLRADRDLEVRVAPMPNERGHGYADYVLWGDDGLPLAVIEAKRTRVDSRTGQQQAKLYADALEAMHGQRPVIFYTNGYEHWIWDDAGGRAPRTLGGFYKRAELEAMVARRGSAKPLSSVVPRPDMAGRPYQLKALGRIAEEFDAGRHKALLVMATGTGKTRTVVSLTDMMMRAGLVKRTLFLADRRELVKQAVNKGFKPLLPESNPVNLLTDRENTGRVYAATYATIMNMIDRERNDGARAFGPGHFDLVVIDEAHRSVYNRYGAIFDYFDSYLVGLTATPRDEVARDTYRLFDLEPGVPTDAYGLEEAIADKWLVPPEPISVPTKFTRGGIRYDDLPQDERDQWDALEWEDGEVPDEVKAEELNRFLFNADTVDKVLGHAVTNGIQVAGGDRLGKTILFAKNQAHAEFIEKRFNANWPHLAGKFARVITYKGTYAQSLIDDFSQPEKDPHLAISVDMLDTGIDVPEVCNLVFFKMVRSKTKFWQMIGRGTRLREGLFGPGRDKAAFRVFDVCGNLEFFGQDPATKEAAPSRSLTERLFDARLAIVRTLEGERPDAEQGGGFAEETGAYDAGPDAAPALGAIVRDLRAELRAHVSAMSLGNFVVRTQRRLVEKYQDDGAWARLDEDAADELSTIAGLPTNRPGEDEAAKRFDLLLFSLQLALLRGEGRFERLKRQLREVASALEVKAEVPAIKRHLELIEAIQTEAWWEGVTPPLLELVRRRLRDVAGLAGGGGRATLYADFEDELGEAAAVALPGTAVIDEQSFRRKVRDFLRHREDTVALQKLRRGLALTATDLEGLEAMLVEAGVASHDDLERAASAAEGLGAFLRSLVGLDEDAARAAFAEFVGPSASANQIEFIEIIVSHLTENGQMTPGALYESPFKEVAPQGPEDVFPDDKVVRLHEIIRTVGADRGRAAGAG